MPEFKYPGPDETFPEILQIPGPECEVTRRYELIDTSRAKGIPLFRVVHLPPAPWQRPEQARYSRLDAEHYYFALSVYRHFARRAANEAGFPARCRRSACRRARACVGNRHEFDWSFPGPWMVPCADTPRLIDQLRDRVRPMLDEFNAAAGQGEAPPSPAAD